MNRGATVAVALATALLLWPSTGVHATMAPGIQGFKLSGTVDRFPCAGSSCGGTLSGVGTATVAGQTTTGGDFSATWPDPTQPVPSANSSGTLANITDSCPVGGPAPSPNGLGGGSFTLSGGLLDVAGQGVSSGATLSGTFDFLREGGTGLVITVSAATITNGSGLVIATQANLVVGVGGGAFAVTNGAPTCGTPISSAQVVFAASYLAPE